VTYTTLGKIDHRILLHQMDEKLKNAGHALRSMRDNQAVTLEA
jgi:hypothetical protein